MHAFDPAVVLDALLDEYSRRANAIRHDLGLARDADFAEQASERQNDEVLHALLAEAEAGRRLVGLAKLRLADGTFGDCVRCGATIEAARLHALPTAECCLACADLSKA